MSLAERLGEFVRAVEAVQGLNRAYIRNRAVEKYSMHNLRAAYDEYFYRVSLLNAEGWNTVEKGPPRLTPQEPHKLGRMLIA